MTKSKIAGFECAQLLAPLVIGITGHRDLREEDRISLEKIVKEIFLRLHTDYRETPLILVSPLAEGADRLAARAAVSAHVGIRLIVPLPMPQELYELDFKHKPTPEMPVGAVAANSRSLEEFRALLETAKNTVGLDLAPGNSYEKIAERGPARDLQYELVGKYIAQQSQILIALWDGVDSSGVGGTASVVRFQTEGVPATDPCELEASEGFPAYHVLTPRLKNPYPQGQILGLRPIYPKVFQGSDSRAEKYYRNMFDRLNEFNRYITHADRALEKEIEKSKSYLVQNVPEDELPVGLGPALNRYAVADALAMRFQKMWFRAQIMLHGLIFGAFTLFLLFADMPEHRIVFLEVSWLLVLAACGLKMWSRKWALDTQHEDYRAMAEGLRVKFFWRLAGINDSVADHYLGKQRSELDWIRNGFRGWYAEEGRENQGKSETSSDDDKWSRLGFVRKYWIDDQLRYFLGASDGNRKSHKWVEWVGNACMAGVLALAGVLLAAGLLGFPGAPGPKLNLELLPIALEVLLAAAAILHHFNNSMGFAEHAKQYQRMASLFGRGSELLGKFLERLDYRNAKQCVRNVGKEALTETGDWVLLHRERPLEVPHP